VEHRAQVLAVFAFAAIVVGGVLHLVGQGATGETVWGVAVAVLAAELAVEVGRTVVVEHGLGVDTIALVAMVGAPGRDPERAESASRIKRATPRDLAGKSPHATFPRRRGNRLSQRRCQSIGGESGRHLRIRCDDR
jgi:hypothetical protein